jgi:hypothetical protein
LSLYIHVHALARYLMSVEEDLQCRLSLARLPGLFLMPVFIIPAVRLCNMYMYGYGIVYHTIRYTLLYAPS